MIRHALGAVLVLSICRSALAAEPQASIHVHAGQTVAQVSPYTLGACIEDVNHEIYGGLYSQMVFGESFQEPAPSTSPAGFTAYGGSWNVKQDELWAGGGDGPKLVADEPTLASGEVSVQIFFAEQQPGNAGLIVKLDQPGVGADQFTGYEIALYPDGGKLLLGRHRQNWEPIRTVDCDVPVGQWITLAVRLGERSIEASVNGRKLLIYEDEEHPLPAGKIALRTWQRAARFRRLQVGPEKQARLISFRAADQKSEQVSGMWRTVRNGSAAGRCSLETERPFVGAQSQRITLASGAGQVGIENRGLNRWGLNFVAGKPYEGYVWARAERAAKLHVSLESAAGDRRYAGQALAVEPGDWQRVELALTPDAADTAGRLTLALHEVGSVVLGHVFLQPGEWGRFRGLPDRRDVGEALVSQGLTVLRYGGSMVNSPGYRWKQMIGPRDRRPPYAGTWYPYSSNGWGIIEFLSFCEAAGFLAVPDLNLDETPQDVADFVEYVNGAADSPWGRRRAADGHPAPFKLRHLQLGNEEAVDDAYWKKFQPLVEGIWAKDPAMVPVVGDFLYNQPINDPYHFDGAPRIKSLAAHKQILDFAHSQGKPVWFDVHIWNDGPRDPGPQVEILRGLIDWLGKLSPEADFRVCVFEENSGNHALRRGLGHAKLVNALQRLGQQVPIVCAANCLQPDQQNENGWDQGLLFLNPSQVWGQPPYYVTQMIARDNFASCLQADCQSPNAALDVTARISDDQRVLVLQVVNIEPGALKTAVRFDGWSPAGKTVRQVRLSGSLDDHNSADDPQHITPWERSWPAGADADVLEIEFPGNSFTVLRLE